MSLGVEEQEECFGWNVRLLVIPGGGLRDVGEDLEIPDGGGAESNVICKSNGGSVNTRYLGTKDGGIEGFELLDIIFPSCCHCTHYLILVKYTLIK